MKKIKITLMALIASISQATLAWAYPLNIEHGQGVTTIEKHPSRVVVFDLASLDTMDALGVSAVGVPDVLLPTYLNRYADEKTAKVGTLFKPDVAAIKALNPDLIIVAGRSSSAYPELTELAPTIDLSIDPSSFETGMLQNLTTLGAIFNKEQQTNKLSTELTQALKSLQSQGSKQGSGLVLFTIKGNVMLHAPGDRFGMLYDLTGLSSVVEPSSEQKPQSRPKPGSEEAKAARLLREQKLKQALDNNPEWLIVLDRGAATGGEGQAEQTLAAREAITQTPAWKSGQTYYLNPTNWYLATGGYQSVSGTLSALKSRFNK
ncbi:siderophore ABC transporter substrate-binding protein [Vibrio sp. EA2]|uniref:siderophore ABC transporter substrate-binding protein n=1 Tax=Vibrio sp. EA2 TaxID=3079860 RepID=UPI00294A6E3E|nr:siderophore ABC transporter substrate-binding protein [Vibrio sp. EA2]MDV6249720.1 siderophore ABC transporter substrate-binding protein [Vibrio sp. EA2]